MPELSPESNNNYQESPPVSINLPQLKPSFGWLLAIVVAYLLGSMGFGMYLGAVEGFNAARAGNTAINPEVIGAAVQAAFNTPAGLAGMYLFQFICIMPVIYWAANFPQQSWRQTLAVNPVRMALLKRYTGILALYLIAETLLTYAFTLDGGDVIKMVQGSQHLGVALVISLLAPIMEEAIFRGYLFKAWRNTRLGFSGTLLLTSLLFTLLHYGQYAWPILAMLFVFSLILGFAREKSGSLLLPILLHGINNLLSVVTIVYLGMDF